MLDMVYIHEPLVPTRMGQPMGKLDRLSEAEQSVEQWELVAAVVDKLLFAGKLSVVLVAELALVLE